MKSLADMMNLVGRVALVTGGAGLLAQAVEEALLEMGASIVIVDKSKATLRTRAKIFSEKLIYKGTVTSIATDLGDEKNVRTVVVDTHNIGDRLDILVHCAAYTGLAKTPAAGWAVPFREQTVAAWNEAMQVNLTAAFVLAQEAAPFLAEHGNGSIIFLGSIYGMLGPQMSLYDGTDMANPVAYGVSKGGIMQLARYLATQLAPDVRVNVLSPGGVAQQQHPLFVSRYSSRTPMGRMAFVEDIKGAVAYLASDLSLYVTGHNLVVDGGWSIW